MHLTPSWMLRFAVVLGKVSGFKNESKACSYHILYLSKTYKWSKNSKLGTKMLALIQVVVPLESEGVCLLN